MFRSFNTKHFSVEASATVDVCVIWSLCVCVCVQCYLVQPAAYVFGWWCTAAEPAAERSPGRWPISATCWHLRTRTPSSSSNASVLFQRSDDSALPGRWYANTWMKQLKTVKPSFRYWSQSPIHYTNSKAAKVNNQATIGSQSNTKH